MPDNQEPTNPYEEALWKAYTELQQLKQQEHELTVRKARIKATIDALFPIVFPFGAIADINSMTLANAIRLVIQSSGRAVTVKEMRGRLQDLGFDLSKYNNPLASIWTAAKRMIDAEELVFEEDEDEKKLAAGPELKPVPDSGNKDSLAALGQIAEAEKGDK